LQRRSEEIIQSYIKRNATKGLENAAVFLIDAETMEVLVWAGSADFFNAGILGQVDGTRAQRSPGSAMKPFIYALGLEQGIIHPLSMMKDLPKSYAFYNPENFDRNYKGIVTATTALVYSLNIPAVDLLQQLDKGSFYNLLVRSDVKNLKSEDFYGLALALGGFELSMQEAVKMYAALYNKGVYRALSVIQGEEEKPRQQIFSPESAFLTLQMLKQNLPTDKNNKRPVYWKTGTSYSYKDAWTIGIVDKYVIGVWIGNFDGTPNHSFVGRTAAAPLFFEIVRMMERNIQMPPFVLETRGLNVQKVDICRPTGDIANALCPDILPSWFIPGISPIRLSDVHREIPVDVKTGVRACRHRPPMTKLEVHEFWPSDILKAFEKAGISKKRPPEFGEDCDGFVPYKGQPPSIQYPISDITYVVRSEKLAAEKVPLKAHADTDVRTLYWFLNDVFLGESAPDEMVFFTPKIGRFYIKVVDDKGRSAIRSMSIQLIQ
ncbi:MAG: hypothetical protein LBU87_06400, partial [Lactobacillales bacterium]|jgi:penicillin-binding protein 1C|nr:hypothetical protein [Lactobacillales bacterium]